MARKSRPQGHPGQQGYRAWLWAGVAAQSFVFWPEEALMPAFQLLIWLDLALPAQSLWGQREARAFTNTYLECQ